MWWLDKEIIRENVFEQKKKKPGLKFNPGLALIGSQTNGPCLTTNYKKRINSR